MIPAYLTSPCADKMEVDLCRESYRCSCSAKCNPVTGRFFITMGHAGFNSEANNGEGYVSEQAAHYAIQYYLLGGKVA